MRNSAERWGPTRTAAMPRSRWRRPRRCSPRGAPTARPDGHLPHVAHRLRGSRPRDRSAQAHPDTGGGVVPPPQEAGVSRADRPCGRHRAGGADRGLARLLLRVPLHRSRGAGHAPAHSGDEPGRPGMASLTIISWRDIPAQVVVRRGRETAKAQLSARFQEAVDRAAMRAGRRSSDAYLADWKRSEGRPCGEDIHAEAAAEAARIEARFSDEQLEELIRAKGLAAGS